MKLLSITILLCVFVSCTNKTVQPDSESQGTWVTSSGASIKEKICQTTRNERLLICKCTAALPTHLCHDYFHPVLKQLPSEQNCARNENNHDKDELTRWKFKISYKDSLEEIKNIEGNTLLQWTFTGARIVGHKYNTQVALLFSTNFSMNKKT